MSTNKTIRIVFFTLTFVIIVILVWCHRVFCRRNDKRSATTHSRLLIKKNWNRKRGRPASASPLHDHTSNRERSASYLPLISPSSSKPPPPGFNYPGMMLQTDINKTNGFNNHVDAYPSTSGAPYPPNLKNNRDSSSTISACHSVTNSTPYPLFSIMPRPSTSRNTYSSDCLRSETPDSNNSVSYPLTHEATRSLASGSIILSPPRLLCPQELNTDEDDRSTKLYSSAHEAPYPLCNISVIKEESTLCRPEHTSYEILDSTKNAPSHEAQYQTPNRVPLLQFKEAKDSSMHNTVCPRTTSHPPIGSTPLSLVQRPPSYEEAMHNKF